MHPNKIFRKSDAQQNINFARQRAFGVLAINSDDGPLMTHIPFILSKDGCLLEGHLVRSNPILRHLQKPTSAAMAVSGPDSYISPDWYEIDDQVPTWNYVALNIRGKLKKLPEDQLTRILVETSQQFEQRLEPKPMWALGKVNSEILAKMKQMIVPIAMDVSAISGTWKLSQNKPDVARENAAQAVAIDGFGSETQILAKLMNSPPC